MIHDNQKDRLEFVQWLKDNGLYYELESAATMQKIHTVYWTMKEQREQENKKSGSVYVIEGVSYTQFGTRWRTDCICKTLKSARSRCRELNKKSKQYRYSYHLSKLED
jgi:hypothetical protein